MANLRRNDEARPIKMNLYKEMIERTRKESVLGLPYVDTEQPSSSETMMAHMQIQHDIETNLRNEQQELHEQRLKKLREIEKELTQDAWRYTPANKLIGLT